MTRQAKPPRAAKIPAATEHQEQRALCAWLDAAGIGYCAIPNAARRSPRQAAYLKAEGMRAGAPDLILWRRTPGGSPVAIELKRSTGGRVSESQEQTHALMRKEGWVVIVARGAADAIAQLISLAATR